MVKGVAQDDDPVTITATVANAEADGWFYLTKTDSYTVTVKSVGTISYAETAVSKLGSDIAFTNTITYTTGDGIGTITYESSNTEVATVNTSTGEVTIVGSGTAIITATVGEGTKFTYPENKASYTLTVTKANAAIRFDVVSTEQTASFTKAVTQDPAEADGTITYTSSDESIATVAAGGVVTKVANGTVTITAKATDGKKYKYIVNEASYKLTFK